MFPTNILKYLIYYFIGLFTPVLNAVNSNDTTLKGPAKNGPKFCKLGLKGAAIFQTIVFDKTNSFIDYFGKWLVIRGLNLKYIYEY